MAILVKTLRFILLAGILSSALLAQVPVITSVLNQRGQTKLCPGDLAVIYGTLPADAARNFAVTVGGKPGLVDLVVVDHGVTTSITVFIPYEAPVDASDLVLSHLGSSSNAFRLNLVAVDPALQLDPYVAFLHTASGISVTPAAPAASGESVTAFATGLGPTNPALATGAISTTFAGTAAPVTLTIAGKSVTPDFAGHYPLSSSLSFEQDFQVTFTVPFDGTSGAQPVTLATGGDTSNAQLLFIGTQPVLNQPVITKITNGANFSAAGPLSAGSFVSIFGTGFGNQDNLSAFPNTQVNGVSVLFNGIAAPIFHLIGSRGQINALIPSEAAGTVTVVVQNSNGPSRAVTILVTVCDAAPLS